MEGRIAWSRYEGNDVEAVVAMLINRERPDSTRITPSKGDGGVDILDRGEAADGGDLVTQVKNHTGPLTASQKSKVEGSLARLFDPEEKDPRWKDLKVTEWHLAMPWDPTPEAEHWLQELGGKFGIKVVWVGLTRIEGLSAKYPEVVDFYLLGGKSAVERAYGQAMALMSLDRGSDDTPPVTEVTAKINEALQILDRDPHYRFETHFGQGTLPPLVGRPGLMFRWSSLDETNSTWQIVDVIARCMASPQVRPIKLNGQLSIEPGSPFAAKIKDFQEYGTPFRSPKGAYSGELDAPGGLGGEVAGATLQTWAAVTSDLGENPQLRVEMLDEADQVLAEAHVDRVEVTHGSVGARAVLREINNVFTLTLRFDEKEQKAKITYNENLLTGKPVLSVLPGVKFLAAFHGPNQFRITPRHLPAHRGSADPLPLFDDEIMLFLADQARIIECLCNFQNYTDTVLTVPDRETIAHQVASWELAEGILRGKTASMTMKDEVVVHVLLSSDSPEPRESFSMPTTLQVKVGETLVSLGQILCHIRDPEVANRTELSDGRIHYALRTLEQKLFYTLEGTELP